MDPAFRNMANWHPPTPPVWMVCSRPTQAAEREQIGRLSRPTCPIARPTSQLLRESPPAGIRPAWSPCPACSHPIPGAGTPRTWAAIAGTLPNRMADVAALAQIAGWNPANLATLAGLFAANAGGRTGGQWAAIAAHLPNREADVATMARIAGWKPANLASLAGLFAANAGGRAPADWATIAARLIDREADVATWARIAAWNIPNLASLAGLFAANAGNRTAGDWATIAAQWIDHEAEIATLAQGPSMDCRRPRLAGPESRQITPTSKRSSLRGQPTRKARRWRAKPC